MTTLPATLDDDGAGDPRDAYRPRRILTLFVGESSPAEGPNFYRANSNLFRATQAAYAAALGDAVPSGEAFLRFFARRGCWLVDLADRSLRDLQATQRRAAVTAGISRLAELLDETRPSSVVAVKSDIAKAVEEAIVRAGIKPPKFIALPYPLRQYRARYIEGLATFVEGFTGDAKRKQTRC